MVHVHTCYTSYAQQPQPTTNLIDHYPKVKGTLPLFMSEKAWAEDYRGRE
ncbi:hypothetical protein BS47DRAFT_1347826 [Hydnum rufescens UP504]|uniref:Uncharacterized protein n=1 Tax=Hydnum rufescens UP504 TaxID=1448309 RepID=A0A9P6DQY5_9AGAM|nr:hypothetical protein BS47DRAFT_1347826 [Hydnum rufescens UP504]